jgi:periplasmic protein TonB
MERRRDVRRSASLVFSVALHAGLAVALATLPNGMAKTWDSVEMTTVKAEKPPIPEPPPLPLKDKAPEAPRRKRSEPKPEPRSKESREPEKAPEAPPVFDLGDSTFAKGGASWSLAPSEGNSRFAAVAGRGVPPTRGTRPARDPDDTGFRPVGAADLTRRPSPANGVVEVPPYPDQAKREGVEGAVVLQVYIDRGGHVRDARIVKDPGGGLGSVARLAMLKERWLPGLDRTGRPVDTVITYAFRFVLDG